MSFKRMEISAADVAGVGVKKSTAKLTHHGSLNLSAGLVEEFKLQNMTHCELFYEEGRENKRSRIQIMFYTTMGKNEMRLPVRKKQYKNSPMVSLTMKVSNTFRARGIMMPDKTTDIPFTFDQDDTMILGIPSTLM